jgi:hypothetical protein
MTRTTSRVRNRRAAGPDHALNLSDPRGLAIAATAKQIYALAQYFNSAELRVWSGAAAGR